MTLAAQRWLPTDFIERARRKPLDELASECGGRFVLVVPITDPAGELAQGLAPVPKTAGNLGFRTLQGNIGTLNALNTSSRSLFPHTWDVPGSYVPIPRHLFEASCHVLCIAKRAGGSSFLDRISVGRAHGHDIVLRDAAVSKFHAWFETPNDGRLWVTDAGSSNHTFVNQQRVNARQEVPPGACVSFGGIQTYVYTLESFWKLLNP